MKKIYSLFLVLLVSIFLFSCGDPDKALIEDFKAPNLTFDDSKALDYSELEDFFVRYKSIFKSKETESCLITFDRKTTYTREEALEVHKSLCYDTEYYARYTFRENYIDFSKTWIDSLFNEFESIESSKEYEINSEYPKMMKIETGSDSIQITNYTIEGQGYSLTTLAIIKGEIYFNIQSISGKMINDIKYYSNNYFEYQVLHEDRYEIYKKDIKSGEFYLFIKILEDGGTRYSLTRGNNELVNIFSNHGTFASFSTRIYKDNQFVASYFRLLDESEFNSRGGTLTVSIFELPNWNKMLNNSGNLYSLYDDEKPMYEDYLIRLTDSTNHDATQSTNFTTFFMQIFLDEDNSDIGLDLEIDLDKIYDNQSTFIQQYQEIMEDLKIDYESNTFDQLVVRFPYYEEIVTEYFS